MRIALVLLFLLCGVRVFAESNPPTPTPRESINKPYPETKQSADTTDHKEHVSLDGPIAVKIIPTPEAEAKTAKQEKAEEEKAANDTLLAYSTVFLAGVTSILAIFTGFLWFSTSRLVRGSEKTAERQLRAYIFASPEINMSITPNGCLSAPIVIKNFGQTPAYDLVSSLRIGLYKLPIVAKLDPHIIQPKSSKSALAPGEKLRQCIVTAIPITEEEKDSLVKGETIIFVDGELLYTDAFNTERFTKFCLFCTGKNFTSGELSCYHEGNYAN